MISDPPSSPPLLSASAQSDSSPSWSRLGEDRQDVNHVFDDDERKTRPLHSRGAEDERRATDVLSIPELGELENHLVVRIRERPLAALAVGAVSGAAFALFRPLLGKAPMALLTAMAMRAGRRLVWQAAERGIHKWLTPDDEQRSGASQAP
jgi:hypothetical protein